MQRDALCQEAQAHQDRQGLPVQEDACPERFRRAIEQGDGQAQEAIECDSSVGSAAVELKVCRKLSVNSSVPQDHVATKICRSYDFGSNVLPRKSRTFSEQNVLVLLVLPVLAASL